MNYRMGIVGLGLGIATGAMAQFLDGDRKATGYIEVGGGIANVTNNQGNWSGGYIRGQYGYPQQSILNFEVRAARRFNEDGVYFGFLYSHYLQPDLYVNIGVASSTSGFYFPVIRGDLSVSKKWGEKEDVVTTLGATYFQARDTYKDWAGFFDIAYYIEKVILQLGARYNASYPGNQRSWSGYGAVTYHEPQQFMLTFRYGQGREAYLPLGGTLVPVDFESKTYGVNLRMWTGKQFGFNAAYEWYENPSYRRNGFEFGVFREF